MEISTSCWAIEKWEAFSVRYWNIKNQIEWVNIGKIHSMLDLSTWLWLHLLLHSTRPKTLRLHCSALKNIINRWRNWARQEKKLFDFVNVCHCRLSGSVIVNELWKWLLIWLWWWQSTFFSDILISKFDFSI